MGIDNPDRLFDVRIFWPKIYLTDGGPSTIAITEELRTQHGWNAIRGGLIYCNNRGPTQHGWNRVLAMYQILLGWKTCTRYLVIYYHEADQLTNPRPTLLRKKLG